MDEYKEGTFAEGYAKGQADERERIALALKSLDDKWAIVSLDTLLDKKDLIQPNLAAKPIRYGED